MSDATPIAIVGLGGLFPAALDLDTFRRNIFTKVDATRAVPSGRWIIDRRDAYDPRSGPDKAYSDRACFVEGFALDPAGLNVQPDLLRELDPLYSMVLHVGRQAYRAGVTHNLNPERVGIMLAAIALPTDGSSAITRAVLGRSFARRLFGDRVAELAEPGEEISPFNARVTALPAGLLAGALGLRGGSLTLDAACASSLYAVKLACEELRARRTDAMLAGGVSRPESLYTQMGFSQLQALSPSGRCRPFDADADGLLVGEGAGMLLLKRLEDALRDGDHIHGVIRGIGLSNDVAGSLLAADSEGQLRAMRAAYRQAGWAPTDVDLIECHGTGTPVGDAAELESLHMLWGDSGWQAGQCAIGSVKSMIGHLLTAAGAAGLIKVLLALQEKRLPPSANFERPAPGFNPDASPFRVQTEAAPWSRRDEKTPRRAAVSAFGFGGINAHMLIEEWDPLRQVVTRKTTAPAWRAAEPASEPAEAAPGAEGAPAPIAIVGMDIRVGAIDSLRAFQELVASGESAIRPRPANRWRGGDELAAERLEGRAMPGAYVDSLCFDVGEFRVPPSEIPEVLPQQMLMLQVAARALEDARMRSHERRLRTGVIIGMGLDLNTSNYHQRWVLLPQARSWARVLELELSEQELGDWVRSLRDAAGPALNANRVVGALGNIIASRIAREFAFGGPSFAISAEEASGLRALEVGVRALQRNELDWVLVGAVDLAGDVRAALSTHPLRPYSNRGEVRPFDAAADGTVVGEGAVALILKRLPDALADRDRVYAVVRGLGFASGDRPACPTQRTYELALERAYTDAGVKPQTVGYVEAHGSGHPQEDRIEAQALGAYFSESDGTPPAIGSVKANIGHTGAASGLASVVKAALCLHHQVIPPLRGFEQPARGVSWDAAAFHLPRFAQHWQRDCADGSRRAGVSAITLDGNCAHVVLEEVDARESALSGQTGEIEHRPPTAVKTTRPRIVLPTGAPPPQPQLPQRPARVREAATVSTRSNGGGTTSAPLAGLAATVAQGSIATARAHEAFLSFSQTAMRGMGQALAFQTRLLDALAAAPGAKVARAAEGSYQLEAGAAPAGDSAPVAYSRDMCMEFAIGSVAKVLGPEFAEVDTYRARVRLPDEPLMLVDRILSVTGEKGALTSGTIVTEHDVLPGGWYLDGDRAPVCIAVEAGQADLFLCSYLGIDLVVKGTRTYRLLDAMVRFHRGLPRPGETIRYEITIDKFARQGETYLFFFRFEATVAGQPLLTVTNGCAGFFTEEEIEDSGGIVLTPEEQLPAAGRRAANWRALVPMAVESYSEQQLDALRAGDLEGCFGPLFAGLNLRDPLRIPGGRMRLVHRVQKLDPNGGRYGLGMIRAEADIHPDDWFLTCHFVDDMVMPGTLMHECCSHALRILLLRMGWVGERAGAGYEPLADVPSKLRCRGPVTPATKVVTYEVQLKEIGSAPEPYVIADAFMYADGRRIVQFTDMSLKISGLSREQVEATWRKAEPVPRAACPPVPGRILPIEEHWQQAASGTLPSVSQPIGDGVPLSDKKPALFDTDRILAFAVGSPSYAFGEEYRPFERDRRLARLPGPPFSFLTRVTEIHAQAWRLEAGGWIEAQYDVPPDAWYFRANRQRAMPLVVLLEIGLQSCGWLAAYLGSALRSERDRRFRNLGGNATLHEEIFPDAGTLTARVRLSSVSEAGETLLLKYEFQLWWRGRLVYHGETTFGFFTDAALAQQVGARTADARSYVPSPEEAQRGQGFALETCAPMHPDDTNSAPGPAAALPARALRMIDEIELFVPAAGPDGLGFIRGVKRVDPDEWFFKAHFYQDPVCPGSLGLEAFLQLLKVVALRRWPALQSTHRFEPIAVGAPHTWVYRGQIIPANRRVEVEAIVTAVQEGTRPTIGANGFLRVDGITIYEMTGFALRLVPVE
ncbi:MAG: beta-ketoacyl synthase N-terminal-like domain-containing protein [Phycisphaerae bacterium]